MKITNNVPNNNLTGVGNKSPLEKTDKADRLDKVSIDSAKNKKASVFGDINSSTKVDLSPRARDIQKAKELATPSDSINEEKVARLQKLIDSGEYEIDADAIAGKMIDEHSLMD